MTTVLPYYSLPASFHWPLDVVSSPSTCSENGSHVLSVDRLALFATCLFPLPSNCPSIHVL